jgi:hypothetical protein
LGRVLLLSLGQFGRALFVLDDAVLCGADPVRSPAELSLVGEHCRGHGGLHAVARGRVDTVRLRRILPGWSAEFRQ